MHLAWATDTHLNFVDADAARRLCAAARGCEGLLLTGDIAEAHDLVGWLRFLRAELGAPVWFVLGNHDFYQGSVAGVRGAVRALCAEVEGLHWMQEAGVLPLTPRAALVGVDGWGDGRLGDWDAQPAVTLNDFIRIAELREACMSDPPPGQWLDRARLREALMALGEEAARLLEPSLSEALARFEEVLVLTHVPPFAEASWHEGRRSDPPWLPHFSCGATGEVLLRAAEAWPRRRIRVLCGHTHSAGVVRMRENLEVRTGGAQYGAPGLAGVVELE
ncbi:MAG: metallophosphoesterase [Alphaproteobacteria bacterium]|nr:metallophosphoesterase [Alphaproteobacteria bacterium]